MVEQILLALVLQISFFIFYYKFGFKVAELIGRRVCPICFTVGSTWLSLLTLKYLGIYNVNSYLIALLLAESVVGVSYLVEEFQIVRQVKFSESHLKFGIIIWGTFAVAVFAFLNEAVGLALFFPVILFGFAALTPVKRLKETDNSQSDPLKSKLKGCC